MSIVNTLFLYLICCCCICLFFLYFGSALVMRWIMMYRWMVGVVTIFLIVLWYQTWSLQLSLWWWLSDLTLAQSERSTTQLHDISGVLSISPYGTETVLHNFIQSTKDILYLQTYDFTHKGFRSLLKKLAMHWTDIRIMQENKKYKQYADTYKQVVNFFTGIANVQIQSDDELGTNFLHSKIILTDDRYAIKTSNLTQSAFKNREYFVFGDDPAIRDSLHTIFLQDRAGERIDPATIHPNLLVCPINCREVLESLIASAKQSIVIQTQYIVDDRILELLKKQSWLDIQIVVADLDSNRDMLYYFGPKIARALPKPYVHSKVMLIDDRYLYVGSINFSDNSMDKNREIGIVLTNTDALEAFKKQFMVDWANGVGKWR